MRQNARNRQKKYREKQKESNVTGAFSNAKDKNRKEEIKKRPEGSVVENESGFKE